MRKAISALEQAVLYICHRFSDQPFKLEELKMNKILWFSDVTALSVKQKTITGHDIYLVQDSGPVLPLLLDTTDLLVDGGLISVQDVNSFDYKQHVFKTLSQDPFKNIEETLDSLDKAILDKWIDYAKSITAMALVADVHLYSWWEDIESGTPIAVKRGIGNDHPPSIQTKIISQVSKNYLPQ